MIPLGVEVKDKITGFKGTVTGYVVYISGCNQCLVNPKVGKDGRLGDSSWFDEQRLIVTNKKAIKLENGKTPGCDKAAPIR